MLPSRRRKNSCPLIHRLFHVLVPRTVVTISEILLFRTRICGCYGKLFIYRSLFQCCSNGKGDDKNSLPTLFVPDVPHFHGHETEPGGHYTVSGTHFIPFASGCWFGLALAAAATPTRSNPQTLTDACCWLLVSGRITRARFFTAAANHDFDALYRLYHPRCLYRRARSTTCVRENFGQ